MARRATVLDKIWNQGNPVLMIDAGDLFGRRARIDREQTRFLCELTSEFGCDAIGLGETDLNYGIGFLREMIDTYQLPFTSANVRLPDDGELILPEYLLIERGGVTFGVCSVLDPEQQIMTMSAKEEVYQVDDPTQSLEGLVPRMREAGAQSIVLLSHLGDTGTEAILTAVPGIDICLVGHSRRPYRTERIFQQAAFLCSSFEGRYIGCMNGHFERASGGLKAFEVEVTELNDSIADDPVMLERVEAFKVHLEEFRIASRGIYQQTKGSADESFLTDRECRKCHQDVWDHLRDSTHNAALSILARKGQGDAPECLVCHTTGYVYIGGYDDKPPANRLSGVQCEACHGYGTLHRRDGAWALEARNSCVTCHDLENSPEFEYDAYWAKIEH
ncbi:hypothetical protein KKG45_13345 [bacterium]|nr:hypothetical protein [bacterium]MBU1074226.1 hypothetical protein [bacterium]MBU1675101.1 hypothetical protein [bacterium]